MEDEDRFHQVGKFFTHFGEDLQNIIEALNDAGYKVCETLDGDMIIMASGVYDDDEVNKLINGELDDDDEDDDDFGNGGMFSGQY